MKKLLLLGLAALAFGVITPSCTLNEEADAPKDLTGTWWQRDEKFTTTILEFTTPSKCIITTVSSGFVTYTEGAYDYWAPTLTLYPGKSDECTANVRPDSLRLTTREGAVQIYLRHSDNNRITGQRWVYKNGTDSLSIVGQSARNCVVTDMLDGQKSTVGAIYHFMADNAISIHRLNSNATTSPWLYGSITDNQMKLYNSNTDGFFCTVTRQ